MDTSRQIFAVIDLLATSVTCAAWWFAFVRLRRAVVFLVLALIQTFALFMAVDNVLLAFAELTFINASLTYFTVISYIQASMWVVQAIAFLFLVRWIVRNCQKPA